MYKKKQSLVLLIILLCLCSYLAQAKVIKNGDIFDI